jgi:hypothetical protein
MCGEPPVYFSGCNVLGELPGPVYWSACSECSAEGECVFSILYYTVLCGILIQTAIHIYVCMCVRVGGVVRGVVCVGGGGGGEYVCMWVCVCVGICVWDVPLYTVCCRIFVVCTSSIVHVVCVPRMYSIVAVSLVYCSVCGVERTRSFLYLRY